MYEQGLVKLVGKYDHGDLWLDVVVSGRWRLRFMSGETEVAVSLWRPLTVRIPILESIVKQMIARYERQFNIRKVS